MKVVTAEQMRDIDEEMMRKFGITGNVLMERAGVAVAARIMDLYSRRKIIVLCGGGNNGGDGIVAARELYNSGWHVKVLLFKKENQLSPDCLVQFRIAKQMGVPIEFRTEIMEKDLHSAVALDAILGTGLNKNVDGKIAEAINFLNKSGAPVLSVDVPSGVSSDTGQIMGAAVKAGYTVTFGLPKRGHLLHPGAEHTGRLFIENIGFPETLLTSENLNVDILEKRELSALVPERPEYSHKGNYGHVLIVAGSRGKTGAAFMTAKACMRTGAGLVTIGVPESLMQVFQSRVTEEMTLPLPDRGDGRLSFDGADVILQFLSEKADVLCMGPGIGVTAETEEILERVITASRVPLVIDADGLNSIRNTDILGNIPAPVILTPHPGEMAGLLNRSAQGKGFSTPTTAIEKDRINAAISLSVDMGVYVALKGVPTVVADPDGRAFLNPTGNPGMATAGTGDVLTGMISSLLAQGLTPLKASILGVYLHGLAGDCVAREKGEHSLVASDIIGKISAAFQELMQ